MFDLKGDEEESNDSDNDSLDKEKKTSLKSNYRNSKLTNKNVNVDSVNQNYNIKKKSSNIDSIDDNPEFDLMPLIDSDDKTKNLNNLNNDNHISNKHINNDENYQNENNFKEQNSLNFDSIEGNSKFEDKKPKGENNMNINNFDMNKDEKINNNNINITDENNKILNNLDNNENVNTNKNDIINLDNNENINKNENTNKNSTKMNISKNDISQNNNKDDNNYFDDNDNCNNDKDNDNDKFFNNNNENNISNNNNSDKNIDKEIKDLNINNKNFNSIGKNNDSFELNLSKNTNIKINFASINNMSQKEDKKNISISNNEMNRSNENNEKNTIENNNILNPNSKINKNNENKSLENSNLNISNISNIKINEINNNISRENNSINNSNNKINNHNEINKSISRKNNPIHNSNSLNESNEFNDNKSKIDNSFSSYNSNSKINQDNGKKPKGNDLLYLDDKNRESKPKNNSKNYKYSLPKENSPDFNQKKLSINSSSIRSSINSNQYDNEIKTERSKKSIMESKSYISSKSSMEINYIKDEYYLKYVELKRKGFHQIINKNYMSGFDTFKECYELSQKNLSDKIKQINSLINMSIFEYYKGNFNNSLSLVEKAKEIFSTVSLGKCHISEDYKNHLELKLLANSSLANLSMNQYKKAISDINKIKERIKSLNEKKVDKRMSYLKYVTSILFKVDSLTNISIVNKSLNKNTTNKKEREYQKGNIDSFDVNQKIMKDFLLSLKYKNDNLILLKSFIENCPRYKKINDLSGYYFCLFNKSLILYNNLLNNNKESKSKINLKEIEEKLYKYYKYTIGEETLNKMDNKNIEIQQLLHEFNSKMECVKKIFNILENMENQLITLMKKKQLNINKNNIKEKNKKCTPFLIKLLIKICLNDSIKKRKLEEGKINDQYENEEEITENINNINKLIKELERLIKKINNYEIDISSINLEKVNENLLNNVKIIIMKISLIIIKFLVPYKKKFMKKLKRYLNQKGKKVIETFLGKNYEKIIQERKLIKINNKTKGYKTNYYNIDDNNSLIIKSSKNQLNPTHNYNLLKDVIKIQYGIRTSNLINKKIDKNNDADIKNLFKTPWRFMSFITKKRSIDLYLEDEQLQNWFYGLKLFTKDNEVEYKLISTTKFVLTRIKLKILMKLKKIKNDISKEEKDNKKSIIRNIVKNKSIESCSFTRLFYIYHIIKDDFD